ncbi:TRAP transporter small permease [Marinivivus vitaminiproducens]|uniref:TRAP transporter small permease n=1 Tax=Marinivivus vitaminiproducens TaxID=3035935 RepID=UPI00279FCF96|nr:TRAP transporter small permease [Geminicoccaceae bacterium SCSIO 64248]
MTEAEERTAVPDSRPARTARHPGLPARAVRAIAGLMRCIVVIALAAVLILSVAQVIDRHVIHYGDFAFDQYSRLGLLWLTFCGLAVGFRERANIRIDLLEHFLPERWVKPQRVVLDGMTLAIVVTLVVVGWRLLDVGSFQSLMDTPLTYRSMYGALLLGLIVLSVFLIVRLVDAATGGRFGLSGRTSSHDPT